MSLKQEESDDVIYEVDVVLNDNRTGSLHLFQFATDQSPLGDQKHLLGQVRARPNQSSFEIDVHFDTSSTTFDKSKSKQIAQFVNGTVEQDLNTSSTSTVSDSLNSSGELGIANGIEANKTNLFPNDIMDRLVLNSEKMNSTTFYYSLGYLRSDLSDLQLIPVSSVCEFKKEFKHFDKVQIQTSTKKTKEVEEELDDFNEIEDELEDQGFKKVTMRFESRFDGKKKNDTNKKQDAEPWKPLMYFDYGSSKFEREKDMILYKHMDDSAQIANGFDHEQMEFSFEEHSDPMKSNVSEVVSKMPLPTTNNLNMDLLNTVSFHAIKGRSLQERIITILCNSQVLPYHEVVRLLKQSEVSSVDGLSTNAYEDSSIVRLLQQTALLVRGNWVVRSDLIFPKPAKSACSGDIPFANVSHEMLCKARNFILFKFTQQRSLQRAALIKQMRIPADQVTIILNQIASFNSTSKLWDFACDDDHDFVASNSEIAQRQAKFWEALGAQLTQLFDFVN